MFAKVRFLKCTCLPQKKLKLSSHQDFGEFALEVKKILQATPPKLRREINGDVRDYNTSKYTYSSSSSISRYEYSLYVLQSRASRSRCSIPGISGRVDMARAR